MLIIALQSLKVRGGLAEWLKALAWKASLRQKRNASSNLASSAIFYCDMAHYKNISKSAFSGRAYYKNLVVSVA